MQTIRTKAIVLGIAGLFLLVSIAHLVPVGRMSQLNPTDDPYTVRGYAAYHSLVANRFHSAYTFTLTVSNDCWAMEVLSVHPTPAGMGGNQVFDGVNLVDLRYFDTNKLDRSTISNWRDGVVVIDDTGMAEHSPEVAPTIWVAYAGQFYLPPGTNGLLRPFWHPDREVRTKAFVPSHWRLLAPESDLPDSIDFYYEAAGWNKALRRGETYSTPTNRSEKPIPVAAYQSFGRTNLGGRTFPLACALRGFAGEREYESGERLPVYEIQVTNVSVCSEVEPRLFDTVFRGVAVVEDFRGQRERPLSYEIKDSAPPGLRDERRLAAARQARQLELAMKRKEVLAKDWTFRTGGGRFGLRVFDPFDGRGGRRYAILLRKEEFSFGDDRARTKERSGVSLWVPALVLLVVAGLVIGLLTRSYARARQGVR